MKSLLKRCQNIYTFGSGMLFVVSCFAFHAWLAYFFFLIGIVPVAILSIGSCIVYLFIPFIKGEDLEQNGIFVVYCEISVFSLLSTMILSMRSGFFLYCLPLPLSSYIEIRNVKRRKYLFITATIAMLLLVPLADMAEPLFKVYRDRMAPYDYMFLVGNFFVVVVTYAINVYMYMAIQERMVKETKYKSEHDALTSVYNRTYFNQFMQEVSKNGRPSGCFIMFDIDNFKQINDKYGHDVGDMALKSVSKVVSGMVRDNDVFVRWGGEEFVIYIEKIGAESAVSKAEEIRKAIADTPYYGEHHLTVSLGVAEIREGEHFATTLKRTDENLYKAKTTGKNRVVSD
ncbi:MAG: GGDEF domain-containing protein [Lachnospiraceae bacterium]|nr:GGDEF domain-containing protein [Lachnospiraceae bacterium]